MANLLWLLSRLSERSDVLSTNKTVFNFREEFGSSQPFNGVYTIDEGYNDVLMDGC